MKTRFPKTTRPFLFGVLGGASLALLLAPAPGRETRSAIHRQAEKSAVAIDQFGDRVVRTGRQAIHSAAATIERFAR